MTKINLTGGQYMGRSIDEGWIECLNLYPEKVETPDGSNDTILIGTPGQDLVTAWDLSSTLPSTPCRGMWTTSWGALYSLYGNSLYYFTDPTLPGVHVGTVGSPGINTPVKMADNGTQLCLVDGQAIYVTTRATSVISTVAVTYTSTDGSGIVTTTTVQPTHVIMLGGYFIVNNIFLDPSQSNPPSNTQMFFSNLFDGYTWQPLNFFTAQGSADPVISLQVFNDQVWAQGIRRFEIFQQSGDMNIPFQPLGYSMVNTGILAPYSSVVLGGTLYWLGTSTTGGVTVFQSNNGNAQRISDHSTEYFLRNPIFARDMVAWAYSQEGHDFIVFTSSNLALTYVWDATQSTWHWRSRYQPGTSTNLEYEPKFAASLQGQTYCGLNSSARIVTLDLDTYTDWDGNQIIREHTLPIIASELQGIVHDQFILQMETGYGNGISGNPGGFPMITLIQSDDAGHTWGTGQDMPMGQAGSFGQRVIWWRRGFARLRAYKLHSSAAVRHVWIAAYINSTALSGK